MGFVFPRVLEVRMEPRQLQRHAGRIIMTFSYRDKGFFLNDSLFGILKGAEVGGWDSGGRHKLGRIVNDG